MLDKHFAPLDLDVLEVLRRYPILHRHERPVALGNRGGFSGARLWQIQGTTRLYCLRAWPPKVLAPDRLDWIHQLMRQARSAGLDFVPAVANTAEGTTWIMHAGRLWDVTTWMPGRAVFHDQPTSARLEAACTALARLHGVWAGVCPSLSPCPSIGRRLAIANDWIGLIQSGWQPPFAVDAGDPVRPWAERAWYMLLNLVESVPRALAHWTERPLPLQPCLCDIWHDHVLFDGDQVTGLIDYGGVKVDHVAVDLARLLGSMVGDDAQQRLAGLRAYTRLRQLSMEEEALVRALDETGTVIAVATWLKWLYRDGKVFEDRAAMARRLSQLVRRMEKWPADSRQ